MSKARDLAGIFNLGPRSGTTAQRPSTAEVGDIFYNGTTGKTEIYTITGWKEMASGIPFGNSAARPAGTTGQPYFNGEEKRLELYTSAGWQNIVSETPGVVSVSGNYLESVGSATLEITGTNFTTGAIASVIGTNGVEVNANSTTVNSIVSISAVFSGLSAANEPYDLKVTNTSNLFGLLPDSLYINQTPTWATASGSLGTFNELASMTVPISAIDSENLPLTYTIVSGSLPSGVNLNSSTGIISGTPAAVASPTTYSFSVTATDGFNTSAARAFSFIVDNGLAEILVVAGGGGGGYHGGTGVNGGGGAGGLAYASAFSIFSGNYLVSVGAGGSGGTLTSSVKRGNSGTDSRFGSIIAKGGGYGGAGNETSSYNGGAGGSGGGATGEITGLAGSTTQSSGSGYIGYGFAGGVGSANNGSHAGGGGGGAGSVGGNGFSNGTADRGGSGGTGRAYSITGTSQFYAAGGGGGSYISNENYITPRASGIGGRGYYANGETKMSTPEIDGVANTGSGGGGVRYSTLDRAGNGSDGVVIVAYPNTYPSLTVPGTLTYTLDTTTRPGYKVYRFTAGSGTVSV
jgi:hypothetical protein